MNKESLEEKGYLIDVDETSGWCFNSINYIYITESQRNPQSTKTSGVRKLREDIRTANFHITHTDKENPEVFNIFNDDKHYE